MLLYVQNNIAYEMIAEFDEALPGVPVEQRYTEQFLRNVVTVPQGAEVKIGWLVDTNTWTFTEPPVPEAVEPIPPEPPGELPDNEREFVGGMMRRLEDELG